MTKIIRAVSEVVGAMTGFGVGTIILVIEAPTQLKLGLPLLQAGRHETEAQHRQPCTQAPEA